jgi:hypothetical protein
MSVLLRRAGISLTLAGRIRLANCRLREAVKARAVGYLFSTLERGNKHKSLPRLCGLWSVLVCAVFTGRQIRSLDKPWRNPGSGLSGCAGDCYAIE